MSPKVLGLPLKMRKNETLFSCSYNSEQAGHRALDVTIASAQQQQAVSAGISACRYYGFARSRGI
jgi:hypothetical protein